MTLYKCNDCGAIFEDPCIEYNHEYFWGAPCVEEFAVCPICRSDGIEEIIDTENDYDEDEDGDEDDG